MQKYPLVRTIYLYLFSLLGLVLITIGGVRFLDMGLKAFVFTKAEEEERLHYFEPPVPYGIRPPDIGRIQEKGELAPQEKEALTQWLQEYKSWEEKKSNLDPVTSRRHRDASFNLALILIGLPLYLYHWQTVKQEAKRS